MNSKLETEQGRMPIINRLVNVDVGTYDVSLKDFNEIKACCDGDTLRAMYYAFKWGFLKGQRSEKSRAQREAANA